MRNNIDDMTMSEIREYVRELELTAHPTPKAKCACGDRRRETYNVGGQAFNTRTGCLTCNKWDEEVVLK